MVFFIFQIMFFINLSVVTFLWHPTSLSSPPVSAPACVPLWDAVHTHLWSGMGLPPNYKAAQRCIRLYPGIFYIAVHPMGELESGCPAQVMVTDILSGKSTAVLRRNIDPLPFANGKMALLGRTDNNMVPNHFPGISDKGRKHIETVRPVLLLQFISCEGSQSGKHVNIGHQLVGYAARRNPARPADNHRNAMPAFPSSELETKKLAVDMVSCLPSSLPP